MIGQNKRTKRKVGGFLLLLPLLYLLWQKHINILANQTKMKNIKGIVIGILVIIATATMMWSVR